MRAAEVARGEARRLAEAADVMATVAQRCAFRVVQRTEGHTRTELLRRSLRAETQYQVCAHACMCERLC